jgi:hypothetical protein
MRPTATRNEHETITERVLFMAFELSEKPWKLGCTTGPGQKPRERAVAARHQARVLQEIAQAKRRFGLPDTAPVVSCYAAGRAGCWRHRFARARGPQLRGGFLLHCSPSPQAPGQKRCAGHAQDSAPEVIMLLSNRAFSNNPIAPGDDFVPYFKYRDPTDFSQTNRSR